VPFAEPTPHPAELHSRALVEHRDDEPYLSVAGCAQRMLISEAEVRRLIRTGVLRTRYGFLVQPGAVFGDD
jgi:hypothetical protein